MKVAITNSLPPGAPSWHSLVPTPSEGTAAVLRLGSQAALHAFADERLAKAAAPAHGLEGERTDAFVLTWAPCGKQIGHSAIGTQVRDSTGNLTGLVALDHLWPRGTVGKSCRKPADYRHDTVPEERLREFSGGEGRCSDGIIRIQGDTRQGAAIASALKAERENPVYDARKNNCATLTKKGLQSAGLSGGVGAKVTFKVGPLVVKKLNSITTPVSVHNALVSSGDKRVKVERQLPEQKQSDRLHGSWKPRGSKWW